MRAAAIRTPWRSDCFPQALTARLLLRVAGVPCALVTMSYQRFVAPVLAALPEGSFAAVVTGDQVEYGKPHPAPYLQAAQLLGVRAEDCVAIEDSPTGIASAEAAGCIVVAVPHNVPIPPAPGRVLVDSLTEVDVARLDALVRRR